MTKTPYFTKDTTERPWYVIDVQGEVLGRVSTKIASLLIGKNRPEYTPGQDCGAFVVILNADKFSVTGTKMDSKIYYRHSGYPGGSASENSCRKSRKAACGSHPQSR